MSLSVMLLGDCMNGKGGTKGAALVHPEGETSMAMSGLTVKIPQ